MAVYVNTNVSGLHGQRHLNNVQNSLNTTFNRLSSGLRINSAKDDSAGLQIADRLTTQINGLNQGNRNAADGIALAQTMEGGMDEISNMLQRIRTLAVQSSNGTNTSDDRAAMQKEVTALSAEISRIAEQTTFGGKTILKGSAANANSIFATATASNAQGTITFQVGANKGDQISLTVKSFQMCQLADAAGRQAQGNGHTNGIFRSAAAGPARFSVSTACSAKEAIAAVDAVLKVVDAQRGDIGAMQNRLESSIRNQSNVSANQADARARIRDTDFAEESANLTKQNIVQQAASSMLMQANMRPQLALSMLG